MLIFANILQAFAQLFDILLTAYLIVIVAYCFISWVNPDPYNPIVRIIRSISEPVLWRIRKYLPFTYIKGIDLSPIVVLLAISFIRKAVVASLFQLSHRM